MARLTTAAMVALAALALAVAFARDRGQGRADPVAVASGAIVSNSRDGQAILSAPNMGPGDSASGRVTVENRGDEPGELTLTQRLRSEQAGGGGGRLYDRLLLEVRREAGSGGSGITLLYSGPVSAMGPTPVGRFEAGASATYSFVVRFPATVADNAVQGASVTLDYEWSASDAAVAKRRRGLCGHGMIGTREAETLRGSGRSDSIRGRAGDDRIPGMGGNDCIYGGHGEDRIDGHAGKDQLRGGYGADLIRGGGGGDVIRGRQQDDVLIGGSGRDRLRGGSGDDLIRASDGHEDRIPCGIGSDTAIVDPIDLVEGCERVKLSG